MSQRGLVRKDRIEKAENELGQRKGETVHYENEQDYQLCLKMNYKHKKLKMPYERYPSKGFGSNVKHVFHPMACISMNTNPNPNVKYSHLKRSRFES